MSNNFTVHVTVSIKDGNGGVANAETWNFNHPMSLGEAVDMKSRVMQHVTNPPENSNEIQKNNQTG